MAAINGITALLPGVNNPGVTSIKPGDKSLGGTDFGNFLLNSLERLDGLQKDADTASLNLAAGNIQDVHTVMIALEKANLGLSLATEVRNKVLDAYREVMRMQL